MVVMGQHKLMAPLAPASVARAPAWKILQWTQLPLPAPGADLAAPIAKMAARGELLR